MIPGGLYHNAIVLGPFYSLCELYVGVQVTAVLIGKNSIKELRYMIYIFFYKREAGSENSMKILCTRKEGRTIQIRCDGA